jgi:hypothetical protein
VYNPGALSGDSAKTEIARAYGRKKLGSQVGRGSFEGLAGKRVHPMVLRRLTCWYQGILVHSRSSHIWLHTNEKQAFTGCGGGQAEQALPFKPISGDFFEAAVLGFNTKNQYQNDLNTQ